MSDRIVLHLNEQRATSLATAAVLADEFVLTHKTAFPSDKPRSSLVVPKPQGLNKDERECFYCHKAGHVIADCLTLKRKEQMSKNVPQLKGVGLINTKSNAINNDCDDEKPDPCFEPFILKGTVSLPDEPADQRPVCVLRDTACSQSVILARVLPFSKKSACGYGAVLHGIELGYVPRPVHYVHVKSDLVTGVFPVAVCPALPIKGVAFLMGNDIAGGKVTPTLEVLDVPQHHVSGKVGTTTTNSNLFPSCAVTRSQAKQDNTVSLSDSFLMSEFTDKAEPENEPQTFETKDLTAAAQAFSNSAPPTPPGGAPLPVSRERLCAAQGTDPTLKGCFKNVVSADKAKGEQVAYTIDDGVLLRRWCPRNKIDSDWSVVHQVVVPTVFRPHVLSVAHESPWSGHLGVTKTYQRILKHFFLNTVAPATPVRSQVSLTKLSLLPCCTRYPL